jgi:hypothetical protein
VNESGATTEAVVAVVSSKGLALNGTLFDDKVALSHYQTVLGLTSRTIEAGGTAPVGHRNNRIHLFDDAGVYLTEHHASRLVESVNFVFELSESLFPLKEAFSGRLTVFGLLINADCTEGDLRSLFQRDMPGEYSLAAEKCWVSISTIGHRTPRGRRSELRYVVLVSISF